MAKVFEWTVEGRGHFPTDMLRYDACYPTDGDSAQNLTLSPTDVRNALAAREVRTVKLRSYVGPPTSGRWASFGWYVKRDSLRKVA